MRIAFAVVALVLVACGGGGGVGENEDPPVYDLNGWWEVAERETGSGQPFEPVLVLPVEHTDATVLFKDVTCTLEGTELRGAVPDASAGDRTEWSLTVISNDRIEGTSVDYSGGAAGPSTDVQMLRVETPTGTLTITGTIGSDAVSVSSNTAYAIARDDPGGPSYTLVLYHLLPQRGYYVVIRWSQLSPIGEVLHVLGGTIDLAGITTPSANALGSAGGFVTIESWEPDHVRGTFSWPLNGGGDIDGAFDVDVLIPD